MRQVKPAGGRAVAPPKESHLPRPKVAAAGVRRGPDPKGHARALIRAHGIEQAAEIAENNVAITRDDYWREVFTAVVAIRSVGSERRH
jgi:hypothetical protein